MITCVRRLACGSTTVPFLMTRSTTMKRPRFFPGHSPCEPECQLAGARIVAGANGLPVELVPFDLVPHVARVVVDVEDFGHTGQLHVAEQTEILRHPQRQRLPGVFLE